MNNRAIFLIIGILAALFLLMGRSCGKGWAPPQEAGLLCPFETVAPWDTAPEKGFTLKTSSQHATQGRRALEVVYPSGGLPSINTRRLRQTWGDYDRLAVDIFNPQKETLNFTIRLDDASGKRANFDYKLFPGANHVRLAFASIAQKIDARHIGFVVLFLNEPKQPYRLFFDNLRLEYSGLLADLPSGSWKEEPPPPPEAESAPLPVRKAVALPRPPPITKGQVRVPLAKLKSVADDRPLISTGIPFAQGQVQDPRQVGFLDQEGKEIPMASRVLARWPQDGSIRALLVQFRYHIPNRYQYVTMKWGEPRVSADLEPVPPIWEFPEGMVILPAEWLCASGVTGPQIPMGQHMVPQYDQNIDKMFPEIEQKPWTGDLAKDTYYSTPHVFYQLFTRTGDPKYFLAARRELLHYREDMLILDGPERGRAKRGAEPRYVYLDAMEDDYFLTGDPRTLEVAGMMADYLKTGFDVKDAFFGKKETRFWTERRYAFILMGLCSYYEMTGSKDVLDLAGRYVDQLYKTQLEWPGRGGFIHNLYSHDPEEGARPDEYGGSPFMTGLLLEGMIKYHQLTGSDTAADSIFRALDWMMREALVSSGDAFRYTTAETYAASGGEPDLNLLIAHAFGYGYRISGYQNEDYRTVGGKVFERGTKDGYLADRKHFNQNYRSSGHFLAYLQPAFLRKPAPLEDKPAEESAPETATPLASVLFFEGFDHAIGRFKPGGETALTVDPAQTYLHGASLRAENRFAAANFSLEVPVDGWDLDQYPGLSFAYRIPPGTPVGLRLQTEFGDWICLGGTPSARCQGSGLSQPYHLLDDGQWHEFDASIREHVRQLLPRLRKAKALRFATDGNAEPGQVFWLDDVRVKN